MKLTDAIQFALDGRAVLFTGAGFSYGGAAGTLFICQLRRDKWLNSHPSVPNADHASLMIL